MSSSTVTCNGDVRWWWRDADGAAQVSIFNPRELALLQTFPSDYVLPDGVKLAHKLEGRLHQVQAPARRRRRAGRLRGEARGRRAAH